MAKKTPFQELSKLQQDILTKYPEKQLVNKFNKYMKIPGAQPKYYLPLMIGDHYGDFWKCRRRYRVVKGSRSSKKTITTARWYIYNMMRPEFSESNLLVVRKVYRTNKDSTFSELKKAIKDLGVSDLWKATTSPLELTYIPTGQKILFRGMDQAQKIAGITTDVGHLCWVWIEEAYELKEESDLDFIDESVRGILPTNLWYQITITFNPWNKSHWLKKRFFDNEDPEVFAITTNYLMNEFNDPSFRLTMARLKKRNPDRYKVAGLGEWGTSEGVVFEQWYEDNFNHLDILAIPGIITINGLDHGWDDPTGFMTGAVDNENMKIYIFDEIYQSELKNSTLHKRIKGMGLERAMIRAESANPKDNKHLWEMGLRGIVKADKGPGSILGGIKKIQEYTIVVHSRCKNFIMELENYAWDPNKSDTPKDEYNHLMDAFRYAMEDVKPPMEYNYIVA